MFAILFFNKSSNFNFVWLYICLLSLRSLLINSIVCSFKNYFVCICPGLFGLILDPFIDGFRLFWFGNVKSKISSKQNSVECISDLIICFFCLHARVTGYLDVFPLVSSTSLYIPFVAWCQNLLLKY